MKIFSAAQIRAWDAFTIEREPVSSLDLMERAALACCEWISATYAQGDPVFYIFCGKGNNGGDGLALARLLLERNMPAVILILEFGNRGTDDFQTNLHRLHAYTPEVHYLQAGSHFPSLPSNAIIVDALLGSGLNRPLEGLTAELVAYLNQSGRPILSIDMPTGLRADAPTLPSGGASHLHDEAIRATHTLALGAYKLGLLLAENAAFFGEVHLLPIGLHPEFEASTSSSLNVTLLPLVRSYYTPRTAFAHKGNFGHALLVAGSEGKMGAGILASRACLRSGAGLLSILVPSSMLPVIQVSVPEAMALTDAGSISDIHFQTFGIGPGLGTHRAALAILTQTLSMAKTPVVLDADALNLLAANPSLWEKIPPRSILTPHPKEFERLFGPSPDDFARVDKALSHAAQHKCLIVLKGHRTLVACPEGSGYFNTTGNAGMATGGSGDVLTGILTGLLAQGYPPEHAAITGVFLHALAGDLALSDQSMESLLASDIVEHIGEAYRYLAGESQASAGESM